MQYSFCYHHFFSKDKEDFKFNLLFYNNFCFELSNFFKANGDNWWANKAFCGWQKGVKKDNTEDGICTKVNLVGERHSKARESGRVGI